MYHISRQMYRELAVDLAAEDRAQVLRACEATVDRLVNDRHYFARPSKTLFAEIRWRFPLPAQRRVFAVIDRHIRETRAYLESSNSAMVELTGTVPTCRATTRRSGLCSHSPDPRTGYCRWHSHLVEHDPWLDEYRPVAYAAGARCSSSRRVTSSARSIAAM